MREREYVYMCMCVYALGSMLPSEVLARPELLCGSGARGRAGLLLTPTGMRLEMLRGICGRGKVQGPSHLLPPDSEILLGDLSRAPKPPVPQCGDGEGQDPQGTDLAGSPDSPVSKNAKNSFQCTCLPPNFLRTLAHHSWLPYVL